MSNLILIRGYEIDIPKTMLQHHIANVVDLEKHLKKLIKKRTNSFRLLVIRINAANINDSYKMYICHKYITKSKDNRIFVEDERNDLRLFTNIKMSTYNGKTTYHSELIKNFVDKVEQNKHHVVLKNKDYTLMYDLYEEMYAF